MVVSKIRKEFPEADGNYTGFKEPSVTEVDLTFFKFVLKPKVKILSLWVDSTLAFLRLV